MISARFRAITAHSKQIRTDALILSAAAAQIKHLQAARKRLQRYPPELPDSNYVRTGDLGGAWDIVLPHLTADGLIAFIRNDVSDDRGHHYAGYVHGDDQGEGQQEVFQNRWVSLRDAIDREGYLSDLRQAVKNAIQR